MRASWAVFAVAPLLLLSEGAARAAAALTPEDGDGDIEVKLILKGGGCENTNAQYSVPVELPHLGRADRTLDGVCLAAAR